MNLRERASQRDPATRQDLGSMGGCPEFSDPRRTEVEVARQASIYQELEFHNHEKVGISADRLKNLIMGAVPELQEIPHWRFDSPLVVFGQIPVSEQAELTGAIYNDIPTEERALISDWQQDLQGYKTPESLYITWIADGGFCMGRTVKNIREILLERSHERRGATLHDGMGLLIVHPEIFCPVLSRSVHGVDLPGTEVGPNQAPSVQLDDYGEDLSIKVRKIDVVDPSSGSASCVRKMIILPIAA